MIRNFRAFHLAVSFYHEAAALKLPMHLSDQLKRASSSIALNLAEGAGRISPLDRRRFYKIAFGSLRECQAILLLVRDSASLTEQADKLAAHIYKLIQNCR